MDLRALAAVALLAFLLTACSNDPDVDIKGDLTLTGGTVDGTSLDTDSGQGVTLTWQDDEDTFRGQAPCNQYGTEIDVDGDEVDFKPVASTAMGCEAPVMEVETRYYDALPRLDHVSRDGDVLTFTGDGVELVFSTT